MTHATFSKLILLAGIILWATAAPANAQSPPAGIMPKGKSRSLDQQLLDDLDRELLQGLPAAKRPADLISPQAGKGSPPTRSGTEAATGDAAPIESQNPLAKVAQRMRSVENRMAQQDTSAATQEEQNRILADLDVLLEAAKKGRQAGGKSGGNAAGSAQAGLGTSNAAAGPPSDSINRIERGTKEPVEPADVKDVLRRFWGHLPQKLRDEMQASLSEQFLPKYERLIEEYYKRLAEERPGGP